MSDQPEALHHSYKRVKDNEYVLGCKLCIKVSDPRIGLGVFATEHIAKGDIIEKCPALQLGWRANYTHDPMLNRYVWQDPCKCEKCAEHGHHMYLLLGYGSLYNHSDSPNAECDIEFRRLLGNIRALADIEAGKEITINYGEHYFNNRKKYHI